MKLKYTIIALIALLSSCIKPTEYPVEPVIEYIGLDKTVVEEGKGDRLTIMLSFTDGDGDLGNPAIVGDLGSETHEIISVWLFDSRFSSADNLDTAFAINKFALPEIPEQGAKNGISGEISLIVDEHNCNRVGQVLETNETFLFLRIADRAGHLSNVIQTDVFTILCD